MAKPTSTSALKSRLATLETELLELEKGAANLNVSQNADGISRIVREMRKVLQRAKENGDIAKL